jgi:putative hydrolase of the HAD superfamily
MNQYNHIFFDLDHTLWDFNTNCRLTLDELYAKYEFHTLGFSSELFFTTYKKINDELWALYHKGLSTKEEIRTKRFAYTFEKLNVKNFTIPDSLDEEFLALCPAKGQVFPYTFDILDYLATKNLQLHIITNGFRETQHIKLSTSGLSSYFTHVIESDVCGFMKPDKRIFDYALSAAGASTNESIMIGDDLYADVLGAKNCGIAQIYVNRNNASHTEEIMHEIDCLSGLKNIL